jgi:CzcA family heavy metal efflux pump
VLSFNLTGGLPPADLHDLAFYVVRPAVARVPGVGPVEVLSSDTREIEVIVDPARLLAAGLTVTDVSEALKAVNQVTPVAQYGQSGRQYLMLASGLWSSVADIERTPIAVRKGVPLKVADVATVVQGAPDRRALVTGNGQPAALLNVSQQVGANILDVRAGVQNALASVAASLPSGLKMSKVYDLGEFVSDSIASVRDAIVIGGLLAIAVLFVFLRDWRVTLVASLTLPLTVVITFLVMHALGETINLMSMGGLAVAIGLVIDDAVVVVENIHRHVARGDRDAVATATRELVAPVLGSTLTTVVVFVPLGMLSGVVGQFFRALSITLSASVLISLVLALALIPLLARWADRPHAATANPAPPAFEARYGRVLERAMRHVRVVGLAAGMLVVAALLLYAFVPSGFLPHMDEGGFVIDYQTPAGTALDETDRQIRKVEDIVSKTPEVAAFSRRTGSELGLFATQQTKGDLLVRLKARRDRSRSADAVIEEMRGRIHEAVPQMDVEFVQLLQDMLGDLEGNPTPIEVKVFGDDPAALAEIGEQVGEILEKTTGVVDVVGMQPGAPEATWQIDPIAAGRLGLTLAQVSEQLRAAGFGDAPTELRLFDRSVPVRVRYPDEVRFDPQRLGAVPIRGSEGQMVPLSALAHLESANGEGLLMRENLRQMAMVTARLEGRDLSGAARELQQKLAAVKLPVGYSLELGGQYESQKQSFRELLLVFGVAVSLVLTVLVVEFGAFTPALLILAAAPLSFAGALLLLLITGTELNVSSAMGFILLVGLVVKNGIVMLDYAHRLQDDGVTLEEAVSRAARVRLRPILMTTLCTLFGLLPLALGWGSGAELQKPLALAVIGGLGLSLPVTLFVVPVFYTAVSRRRRLSSAT